MGSPFVGVWEVVSDVFEGFWIFTETHFNLFTTGKNRKHFQGSELTQEEAAEVYRTLRATSGTYSVSGSTVVIHYTVSRVPNFVGEDAKWEFEIQGDRRTGQGKHPDGRTAGPLTFRKVS